MAAILASSYPPTNSSDQNDSKTSERLQCFVPMPSRRFWSSRSNNNNLIATQHCRLCPSMDLMVVENRHKGDITLYRTVLGGPKLATLSSHISCWKPDGALLATVNNGNLRIDLHSVESILVKALDDSTSLNSTSKSAEDIIISLDLPETCHETVWLQWVHQGKAHPLWRTTRNQQTMGSSFMAPVNNKNSDDCLPPSQYHQDRKKQPNQLVSDDLLHALFVVTRDENQSYSLHCYLQGCFPILTGLVLPMDTTNTIRMAVSSDMCSVLIQTTPQSMVQYRLPLAGDNDSPAKLCATPAVLRTLATWRATIQLQHIPTIQSHLAQIDVAWKSCWKALEQKLQSLWRLLQDYSIVGQPNEKQNYMALRFILRHYVAYGRACPFANAMDQFFTGINDTLLQRTEASISVAMANLECNFQKYVTAPTYSIVHQVLGTGRPDFPNATEQYVEWQRACQDLFVMVTQSHQALVEARLRIRDWILWLRSTSAQVKARGTGGQPRREIPSTGTLVPRMMQYWKARDGDVQKQGGSILEQVLRLSFGDMLREGGLPKMVERFKQSGEALFNMPWLPKDEIPSTLWHCDGTILVTTTRKGCGRDSEVFVPFGEEPPTGFFCPNDSDQHARSVRQWFLVVERLNSMSLRLHALPLVLGRGHCWSTELRFNQDKTIVDVSFYQDDGTSSREPDSGKEGSRQSIGFLLKSSEGRLELWLVPYDTLEFGRLPLNSTRRAGDNCRLPKHTSSCPVNSVVVKSTADEEESTPNNAHFLVRARTRVLDDLSHNARLELCASRGMSAVCGITHRNGGGTMLELFDLEDEDDVGPDDEMEGEE